MSRSIIPYMLEREWWDFPRRLTDQNFGQGFFPDDLISHPYSNRRLRRRNQASLEASGISEVINDQDKFKVLLDVIHFTPNDLSVKTVDNFVVVHGKHEEKSDEHGFVSREFTRRYMLPTDVQPEDIVSSLGSDGVLVIQANKKPKTEPNTRHVSIAVMDTPANKQDEGDAK